MTWKICVADLPSRHSFGKFFSSPGSNRSTWSPKIPMPFQMIPTQQGMENPTNAAYKRRCFLDVALALDQGRIEFTQLQMEQR